MGACFCKDIADSSSINNLNSEESSTMPINRRFVARRRRLIQPSIESLILAMLKHMNKKHAKDKPPLSLRKLIKIANSAHGWSVVLFKLIHVIPLREPLGPSAITAFINGFPLQAKDTITEFTRRLNLSQYRFVCVFDNEERVRVDRNLLILLGGIAQMYPGPSSAEILDDNALIYLVSFLTDYRIAEMVLYAIIALEKFALTPENKLAIENLIGVGGMYPLWPLEAYHDSNDYHWRQVGFCTRWALDNTFSFPDRKFSYESVNLEGINAMLDAHDKSQYLKISPDGLEARSDAHTFESVRGTFRVDAYCWYYEVQVITAGVMQIGWATKETEFLNIDGFGVGDDRNSIAYDGCRRLIWFMAEASHERSVRSWQPGDILGCLIDLDRQEAIFSLNGKRLRICTNIFSSCSKGFYPATSFMAHQQCRFNFGSRSFEYPPLDRDYCSMNRCGKLTAEQKMILPQRVLRQELMLQNPPDDSLCVVCYDKEGLYYMYPCNHGTFCYSCLKMVNLCPLCRGRFWEHYIIPF